MIMASTVRLLPVYVLQTAMVSLIVIRFCYTASSSTDHDALTKFSKTRSLDTECPQDKQWFCFNSTTKAYSCNQAAVSGRITCSDNGPRMKIGSCATYDDNTRVLSFSKCQNQAQINGYNRSKTFTNYIQLPTDLTELNDYMCGPLNRKGVACSECADGFGPSVTSIGYKCINCSNTSYGVLLFLIIKLFPITVLYIVILAFQISITSAPMPCFIMHAQIIASIYELEFYHNSPLLESVTMNQNGDINMFTKIVDALYGIFHLEFFHFFLTPGPFCMSSRLKSIHIALFGCISIIHPLLLIFITWLCVELHGRNFRPLVWLWRPFHRCFVRLRRGWDTKSDIIDVFITFLLLSYSTVLHQSVLILGNDALITIDASGKRSIMLIPSIDRSLTFKNVHYYFFMAPSLIMFLIFNLLPPLLLILYPMKAFQSCLSKCHLNSITLKIFVEKVQGCYRNGLDGGRDMRSFSGLYFLLQFFILIVESFAKATDMFPPLFLTGVIFSITALTIALVKPYKKTYMACLDTLILLNLSVLSFIVSLGKQKFPILQVLLCIPIIIFVLVLLQRKALRILQIVKLRCKKFNDSTPFEPPDNNSSRPLILPTSTVLSYGTTQ